jgi:hypothetical protein
MFSEKIAGDVPNVNINVLVQKMATFQRHRDHHSRWQLLVFFGGEIQHSNR